jgi:hypothetical protein
MNCPKCNTRDDIWELGTIEVMYRLKRVTDKYAEYDDSEFLEDTYEMYDYPYYCRHCDIKWDYDLDKKEYYPEPV